MSDKTKSILKEWVIPFAVEILVVFLVVKYVFFFIFVPTGSMIPTIMEKSFVFATRVHNPERSLERGDIVVFYSDELGETLVKRLIGMPGDHVELDEKGKLSINGEAYPEPYVKHNVYFSGTYDVPEGCYLFFGDNRLGSYDARSWDNPYIPAEKITGEAKFTLYPFDKFGFLK